LWLPGTTWGPGWVAWRSSPDWVGWAPLPPDPRGGASGGVRTISTTAIPPTAWCFAPARALSDRNVRPWIAAPSRNPSLLSATRDATHYLSSGGRIVDAAPGPAQAENAAGRPVRRIGPTERSQMLRGR